MNLSAVLSQLVALFLMIFAGYLSARAGLITPQFRQKLSSLALNTAAPCIILSSVLESESSSADMTAAVGIGAFFFALMIALAALLVRVCRVPRAQRGLDQLMLVFTNVGFMGIPVVQSIYGPTGVALLSMFILIFNLCFFSYGVLLISSSLSLNPRALLNSCIVAALLALLFGLTGWHLPAAAVSALSAIGAMNTPLAMMIIGASIAHSDLRAALSNPRLYRVCLLRMVVMPLCILGIVSALPIPSMLAGICVALAAMPVAGNCAMISDLYTPEDMTASQAVMLSTLLSAVTLPLICAAMLAVLG